MYDTERDILAVTKVGVGGEGNDEPPDRDGFGRGCSDG